MAKVLRYKSMSSSRRATSIASPHDTPNDDLHGFRGFYEPYKEEWLSFDPEAALAAAGFTSVEQSSVAPPLWTVSARRPG